jgi:hypothetical protein
MEKVILGDFFIWVSSRKRKEGMVGNCWRSLTLIIAYALFSLFLVELLGGNTKKIWKH